jgi:hypothetical protein
VKALLILLALAAPAHAGHACAETSEVLGHRHCSTYGAWGALARFPSITFDTEMFHEHFATPPLGATPVAGIFATTNPQTSPDATAWGVRLRVGAPLMWRPLYLAFELDIGGLSAASSTPSYALLSQAVAALGAHAHVTQTIMLSAELAGGGRMYSWMTNAEETIGSGVVEARGRIDWWATPHLTFGASIGTSLIDSGDQTFTVGFAGHLRAFDGYFY